MVVVGVLFEMVVVMLRDMREDELEADFKDDEGNGDT